MAKSNKPQTKPKLPVKEDIGEEINIDLQKYLTPISIIVSGVLISVAILLTGRAGGSSVAGTSNTAGTVAQTQAAVEENPAAQTSIADSPYLGNKETAKVAIVEYSDFECPYCKRHVQQVWPDIKTNYIDTGKAIYVYRNYIAVPSHNPVATTEAYAALCVRELSGNNNSKYFEYHDLLYTNTGSNGTGLQNSKTIYSLAGDIGINQDQLKTCVESAKYKDTMTADEAAAGAAGVQGTPGFIVGKLNSDGSVDGKLVAGAYPFTTFQALADAMLQ